MREKVTHKDVAAAVGVSTFTVSQALSGKAGVSKKTRERVLRAADELGYLPNAAASLLARNRSRGGGGKVVIAHVGVDPDGSKDMGFLDVCQSAALDGREILPSQFQTPQAMLRGLRAMGVNGLFMRFNKFPWSADELLTCDWGQFSVMKTARVYPEMNFHLVRHSAFDYMRLALRRILDQGYRRVAVLLFLSGSDQDDEARLGAILAAQYLAAHRGIIIEWRYWQGADVTESDPQSQKWLREFKPDAILGYVWVMVYPLLRAGWRIPDEVGFAAVLGVSESDAGLPTIAGCRVYYNTIARRGTEALAEMIGRGERGFPARPIEHVIEPEWEDGDSLPMRICVP